MAIETAMGTLEAGATTAEQQATQSAPSAQDLISHVINTRLAMLGGGGGLTTGPTMGTPALPLPPMNPAMPGIPQGNFQSTGEMKRAEQQHLFQSLGSIVNSAVQRHYQQKVQKLGQNVELLMNAVRGYNEGKSTSNQDMMSHNAAIINKLMSDEATAKGLAKAFNVDLNPMEEKKKNKKQTPEADAVRQAFQKDMQDFQKKRAAGDKTALSPQAGAMMRSVPQTLQADPRMAAITELVKNKVLPSGDEELKANVDIVKTIQHAANVGLTNDTKEKIARGIVDARDRATQGLMWRTVVNNLGAGARTDVLAAAVRYRADKMLSGVLDRNKTIKAGIDAKGDTKESKALKTTSEILNTQAATLKAELADATKRKDYAAVAAVTKKIEQLEKSQQVLAGEMGKIAGIDPSQISDVVTLDQQQLDELQGLFKDSEQEVEEEEKKGDEENK